MKHSTTNTLVGAIASVVALAGIQQADAADALAICTSGQPYAYPNNGANIVFNPDQGPLNAVLTNADGVAATELAFAAWENLDQSAMTSLNGGPLPEDVSFANDNWGAVLGSVEPDGLSPVVFDQTGEIFDVLFGPGSGILGFAGPEFGDPTTCELTESLAFLNGPAFIDATVAEDIMVHEFGHYINLGHVELNGQLVPFPEGEDDTGPSPDNATFPPPASLVDLIETMYPFYFGPLAGTRTPHPDDVASISMLYPAPDFSATTGKITGTVLAGLNGDVPTSGVNVIARNINDPFADAVSTFSGAFTNSTDPSDPNVGRFTLAGLTPGEQYAVFIDQVTAAPGRFSNPIITKLPGPEEFYNGAAESSSGREDNPLDFVLITAEAGNPVMGVDIQFNVPQPGDPLDVGDDGAVELFLPFEFEFCGVGHDSVFVNANGHLTFGQPDPTFFESVEGLLNGPPRIAPLWRDVNPASGGAVFYQQTRNSFTVVYDQVPSWFAGGPNTFSVTLKRASNGIDFDYGALDPTTFDFFVTPTITTPGLAGVSCGLAVTSGLEAGGDLSTMSKSTINLHNQPAVYEVFTEVPNEDFSAFFSTVDLENSSLRLNGTTDYNDNWAGKNNVFGSGRRIKVPFNSAPLRRYTEIEPAGRDADHFRFNGKAGEFVVAEITRGQIDSLLCLFDPGGNIIALNDDSNGLLSQIVTQLPVDGEYSLAVSTFPDFECNGTAGNTSPIFGEGRYILDASFYAQPEGELIFNGSFELGFAGWDAFVQNGEPFIPWLIGQAGDGAGFGIQPVDPQDGSRVIWNGFDGSAGTEFVLAQFIDIPVDATKVTMRWQDRGQWLFFAPNPEPRVAVVALIEPEPPFEPLQLIDVRFTGTEPGVPIDWGWRSVETDISAFAGQRVGVLFLQIIPEEFTGPGQFEIDGVSVTYE